MPTILKFSSCISENKLLLHKKVLSINARWEMIPVVLRKSHQTCTSNYTVWKKF
jgi:hypothetical protein